MITTKAALINAALNSKAVFRGDFLLFQHNKYAHLIAWQKQLRQIIEHTFAPHPPCQAHEFFTYDEFYEKVDTLYQLVNENYKNNIIELLRHLGYHSKQIYWDKLALRIVPPKNHYAEIAWHEHTPVHRDTWGVNIYAQINFWSSLFPLNEKSTMEFYPQYWHKAVTNTSATWSYAQYRQSKKQCHKKQKVPYPSMPQCLIKPSNGIPVLINPFDWLIFSGAHLHRSIPNTSPLTRFSLEFRIVDKEAISQPAAPNVDNMAHEKMSVIFSNITNGERLTLKN